MLGIVADPEEDMPGTSLMAETHLLVRSLNFQVWWTEIYKSTHRSFSGQVLHVNFRISRTPLEISKFIFSDTSVITEASCVERVILSSQLCRVPCLFSALTLALSDDSQPSIDVTEGSSFHHTYTLVCLRLVSIGMQLVEVSALLMSY